MAEFRRTAEIFRSRKKLHRSYDERVASVRQFARLFIALAITATAWIRPGAWAQSYTAPAGVRQALRREGASILPGGRIVAPYGKEHPTGPGPFALVLSPSG